jgi:hypothetical protein
MLDFMEFYSARRLREYACHAAILVWKEDIE